jgi:hypothetical protein
MGEEQDQMENYSKVSVLGLTLNVSTQLDSQMHIGQVQYYNP